MPCDSFSFLHAKPVLLHHPLTQHTASYTLPLFRYRQEWACFHCVFGNVFSLFPRWHRRSTSTGPSQTPRQTLPRPTHPSLLTPPDPRPHPTTKSAHFPSPTISPTSPAAAPAHPASPVPVRARIRLFIRHRRPPPRPRSPRLPPSAPPAAPRRSPRKSRCRWRCRCTRARARTACPSPRRGSSR